MRELGQERNESKDLSHRLDFVRILGVKVHRLDMAGAVKWISDRITEKRQALVVTANAELVVRAFEDAQVGDTIATADLVVPDGVGLLWAGSIFGHPFPQRVPGIELSEALIRMAAGHGWKVVFYGGQPGVANEAAVVMEKRYPGFKVAACYHGFLKPEEEAQMLNEIDRLQPDLLLVATGAPRQEQWVRGHRDRLPQLVAMGVGGSFDVFAGKLNRAPRWMSKFGLEWLYRLVQEPSRYKRMLALPRFVFLVLRAKWLGERGI